MLSAPADAKYIYFGEKLTAPTSLLWPASNLMCSVYFVCALIDREPRSMSAGNINFFMFQTYVFAFVSAKMK